MAVQSKVEIKTHFKKLMKQSEHPHVERHPRVRSSLKICLSQFTYITPKKINKVIKGVRRAGLERRRALAEVFQQ